MTTPATHESYSPPEFRERVMALAGNTTFRQPLGGRATGGDHMPAAHAVCAALAYARQGSGDLGPDIAICWALGTDAKRAFIIASLARAMRGDRSVLARRNRRFMGYVANVAFDVVIHGRRRPRLEQMRADDWDMLVPAACKVLECLAEAALSEAERAWKRRAA